MTAPTSKPLAGVKVLDLTTFLSGPYCTQILGDLGADVVKVEPPEGDSSRAIPPHFVGNDSAYFLACNRGKRSIAIDLKAEGGAALVRRLIAEADVVVENFRPGVPARLGLNPDDMTRAYPNLVWASISGYGQTGPWAQRPAYDMIVQALSGVMSLTGPKGGPSVRLGIPAGDTVAGLYATIAITAALAERAVSGRGRRIDVGMLDCQLAMLSYQSAYALIAGVTPTHQGAAHDSIPTYRSFTGSDGRAFVVTANTQKMWRGLCSALGRESMADDPRFADGEVRLAHREALWAELESIFSTRGAGEWVERLTVNDVPAALIKTVPEALEDARVSGRDMILSLKGDSGNVIEVVGNPIRFCGTVTADLPKYPPPLGVDASDVLTSWLGFSANEVTEAIERGAVVAPRGS